MAKRYSTVPWTPPQKSWSEDHIFCKVGTIEVNEATKTRTITHIDELFEVTITPFPAYKEASVIVQKQRTKEEQEKLAKEQEEAQAKEQAEKEQKIKNLDELLND